MVESYKKKLFKLFLILISAVISFVIFIMVPTAQEFIMDRDNGFQLLGAQEILFGRHPFIDFKTPYGPLVFYASAIAQALSNSRIIGEIILISVGYLIAYLLLFIIEYRVSQRLTIAAFVTVLSLLFFPFFHKYYVLLGPALILAAMLYYSLKQSCSRLFFLAAALTLTMLFRFDYGVYGFAGSAMLIFFLSKDWIKPVLALILFICALYSPWLLALGITGHLYDYIYQATIGSVVFGYGTSLQLPRFAFDNLFSHNNANIILLLFFFLLPFATIFTLLLKKKEIERHERAYLLGVALFATLSYIQTLHRIDIHHLFQSIAPHYILLAWHGKMAFAYKSKKRALIFVCTCILLLIAFIFLLSFKQGTLYRLNQFTVSRSDINVYFKNKEEYIEYLLPRNPQSPELRTIDYIRSNKSITSMISLPFSSQLTYWAGLPLGSSFLFVSPGYFSDTAGQINMINELKLRNAMAIVYRLDQAMPTRDTKTMAGYLPLVHTFIINNYTPSKSFGPYTVYIHK